MNGSFGKKIILGCITLLIVFGLVCNAQAIKTDASKADNNTEEEYNLPVMTDIPPKTTEMLEKIDPNPEPTMSFDSLPSQFSWKSYGGDWTTGARDQGNCGSCWDFSALAAMEAAINIASGNPSTDIDLSEQYVLSCLSSAGSCSGGWMSTAIEYIKSTSPGSSGNSINGVCIESCMPYTATDSVPCSSKCSDWDSYSDPPQSSDKLFQILDYGVTTTSEDNPGDWNFLKTWLMTYGPLSIDINANGFGSWGSSHHSPTDVYENDNGGYTNHGVLLVGWVDDSNIMNGGYWIIKNSWGSGWGYGGFGNIAYGCNGVATRDCVFVTTPSWPSSGSDDGGPVDVDAAVFSDFEYRNDAGMSYPRVGEEITFIDTSDGEVSSREWDFDGDGVTDSTKQRATWTYNREGSYEATLTVRSEWGIESNLTRIVKVKDIWPPMAKINPSSYADNELEVSFDGRFSHDVDGGKITSYHWDFDDGTTSDEASVVHTFPEADKIYNVVLTVTDNEGASSSANCTVAIDQNVPPETSILHGFGDDGSDWYSNTERISFYAVDWTSVLATYYRIDDENGDWIRYIPEEQKYIPVSGEGMHTVECYSVDYYNNEEPVVSETFGIDISSPSLDVSISGNMENGWYLNSAEVSASGSDSLSGLDYIKYKIDGGILKDYSSSLSIPPGQHYIMFVAADEAGNVVSKNVQVNVDGGDPVSHVIFDGEGADNIFYQSVDVRLSASDSGAGVENVYYRLDNLGGFTEYGGGSITVDEVGEHVIEFYAVDNLGNEEDKKQITFTISPANFVAEMTQPENGLYVFGAKLFNLGSPVIIGPLDVTVDVEVFTGGVANIEKVEFLVDGDVVESDSDSPYSWMLDDSLMGSHDIGVNVISDGEVVFSDSVNAMCIIF